MRRSYANISSIKRRKMKGYSPLRVGLLGVYEELAIALIALSSSKEAVGPPLGFVLGIDQHKVCSADHARIDGFVTRGRALLESHDCNAIFSVHHFVCDGKQITQFVVINVYEQSAIRR